MNTAEIKARAEAAPDFGDATYIDINDFWPDDQPEFELYKHAKMDLLNLTAEVERLNKDIEDLKEAHANKASEWLAAQRKLTAIRKEAEPITEILKDIEGVPNEIDFMLDFDDVEYRYFNVCHVRALAEELKEESE